MLSSDVSSTPLLVCCAEVAQLRAEETAKAVITSAFVFSMEVTTHTGVLVSVHTVELCAEHAAVESPCSLQSQYRPSGAGSTLIFHRPILNLDKQASIADAVVQRL